MTDFRYIWEGGGVVIKFDSNANELFRSTGYYFTGYHPPVAVDPRDGSAWVGGNTEIWKFDSDGHLLLSKDLSDYVPNWSSANTISINENEGSLWIGDHDGDFLKLNSSNGDLLLHKFIPGGINGPLVNPEDGTIWVADHNAHQVVKLDSDGVEMLRVGAYDTFLWPTPRALYVPVISATVNIDPDTLNSKSKGRRITACIQLPEEYDPEDIDATTILLNDTIQPVLDPKYDFVTNSSEYLVDHNEDGILERMVKFDRAEVMALLNIGEATLTVTGEVNGTPFEGTDTIRVISK